MGKREKRLLGVDLGGDFWPSRARRGKVAFGLRLEIFGIVAGGR